MMQSAVTELCPVRGLSESEAATYLGINLTCFRKGVRSGRWPRGTGLEEDRWSVEDLDRARRRAA